jgi:hypothetical protein
MTELSTHTMDEIVEIQCNLDPSKIEDAIAALSPEAKAFLREACKETIDRMRFILDRLAA